MPGIQERKCILLLVMLLLIVVIALSGCSTPDTVNNDPKTELDLLWDEAPEGTLAILINLPTPQQLLDYPATESLLLDQTDETILVLPAEDLEQITIWSMKLVDENFVRDLPVYRKHRDWEGFVLELSAIRPEGGPLWQMELTGPSGTRDYYFTYDGQFGTPNFEYIEAK